MIIKVTQEDIDNGLRRAYCHCPVALAATRALGAEPNTVGVQPIYNEIVVYRTSEVPYQRVAEFPNKKFKFSDDVKKIILEFDASRSMTPFEFEATEVSLKER